MLCNEIRDSAFDSARDCRTIVADRHEQRFFVLFAVLKQLDLHELVRVSRLCGSWSVFLHASGGRSGNGTCLRVCDDLTGCGLCLVNDSLCFRPNHGESFVRCFDRWGSGCGFRGGSSRRAGAGVLNLVGRLLFLFGVCAGIGSSTHIILLSCCLRMRRTIRKNVRRGSCTLPRAAR
ncbi:hypothetical protein SDC9_171877 [bioreactor metagenome]|uniref:F-box domain-containing protein n=1 Tax=bioreactor metagenome TaxID=1076179 RepID=A0A645GC28_9ZZZZ